MRAFGDVKVDKPEQKMVLSVIRGNDRPWTDILEPGETYRVCCPWCDDGKFHLNINHAFGTRDPRTGHLIRLNNCFRCGPHTGELLDLLQWQTVPPPQVTLQQVRPAEGPAAVYTSPGTCVPLSDPRAKVGRDYLAGRGIDPDRAGSVYGVTFCVQGNPEICATATTNRIIVPVTLDGVHVGWQARLTFEPNVFDRDRGLANLRWFGMPGAGWRSQSLVGYDQARGRDFCILVEGPSDVLRQGPPCVGSLGQTVSYGQARLIGKTWGAVIIVGDAQENPKGAERCAQARSVKLLAESGPPIVRACRLPQGDPGSWDRAEFFGFIRDELQRQGERDA